jgi:hypothetical protein
MEIKARKEEKLIDCCVSKKYPTKVEMPPTFIDHVLTSIGGRLPKRALLPHVSG